MNRDEAERRVLIEATPLRDRDRRTQRAAFALLLEGGRPVLVSEFTEAAGLDSGEVEAALEAFTSAGRTRFDSRGRLTGIAGLSVEPTRHEILVGPTPDTDSVVRWTWCALDAVGILGALGRGGRLTSTLPEGAAGEGTTEPLVVEFTASQPEPTPTVILLTDGYGEAPIVENWCPTVNLFPDRAAALGWAADRGVTGRAVPVAEIMADAIAMWAPVVPNRP